MKREYSTPEMKVEVFEASESVAACWKIKCNVPSGIRKQMGHLDIKKDTGIRKLINILMEMNILHLVMDVIYII